MFQFPSCPSPEGDDRSLHRPGCPIRRSVDHCVLAAPYRVSSLGTSFLGTSPQGIRQKPCVALEKGLSAGARPPSLHLIARAYRLEPASRGGKPEQQKREGGEGRREWVPQAVSRYTRHSFTHKQSSMPQDTHSLALLYFTTMKLIRFRRDSTAYAVDARAVRATVPRDAMHPQNNSVSRPIVAALLRASRLSVSGSLIYTTFPLMSRPILRLTDRRWWRLTDSNR